MKSTQNIPPNTVEFRNGLTPLGPQDSDSLRPQSEDQTPPAAVRLYLGSALSPALRAPLAWGGLRGCDVATMIEVIEHLDPPLLELVGPCLLGGLQPRTLVVTTPNWEYNKVMRAVELLAKDGGSGGSANDWPGPPDREGLPMRCNDHRFEWTQDEFQAWAMREAKEHDYSVRFEAFGHCVNQEAAIACMQKSNISIHGGACNDSRHLLSPADGSGGATQAAIFTCRKSA